MAIRLDEARLRLLKIVDTSNTVKIYPNTVSSYGGLAVEGYTKGGYQGIHLGSSTNYMTVMSGEDQQGLYNQAAGRWVIYYKRTSDAIGIGTSDLVANNRVTITNNASITNLLTVGYGTTHYGIKVGNTYINAINGDLIFQNNNNIRFGADDWDYNKWAGLKYDSTNKYIYLGIADGTIFSANSSQSGGRILTPGIGHFHVGNQTNYYFASNGDIVSNTLKVGIAADQATSPGVGIQVHDLRNVTPLPGMFGDRQVNFYFDQITDDYGGSSGTKWMSIMHMKGWTGSYSAWELAGNADNSSSQDTLRYRQGRDSTWGDWQSILTDANFTTYLDGTYVNASGDTITGTLILSKSQDASGTANNKPALIIGGTDTQAHIEIDNNEVMAKTNGTSVAELHLNADGGKVNIGNGGLYVGTGGISTGGNITASASNTDGRWVRATNSNGSVSTYTSTNRGLYDHTRNGWIIYDKKDDNTWVYIPIALKVESNTDSTSTSTGAIVTAGGIGVAKNIYSGQQINAVQGFGVASTAGTGVGISLYNGSTGTSAPTYGLMFAKTASFSSHVDVSGDWATYLTMSNTLDRGWIFRRGSTNVASISGSGIGAFAGITKDTMHILAPTGGHYYTSDSTKTGYLKITLPVSWTSAMVRFIVDIYDYSEDNTVTYIIGGYNYVNDSKWYSMSAQCISKWGTGKSNLDVRFGHDGSKCAIYIGASNTSWSYPQVVIRDVVIGYGQYSKISDWSKNWSISFTTSLGTITGTKNNTNTGYSVNYSGSSGYAAEAGALRSPNNGTLAYLDWTGQQTSCTWFATWDESTYSGKPTVRAMSAANMRSSLNVPTRTGGDASGTWGINISGNAATASSVAWGNITGKPSTFSPSSHTHNYLPLTGGTISGNVSFSAAASGTSPLAQRISINGVSGDTSVANAPGIGFHTGNVGWGSIKCVGSSFYFYNSDCSGYVPIYGSKVYGAVWNDYAEYRNQFENISDGRVAYCKNDGKLRITTERLQRFEGVVSDTFGFAIGETDNAKTPLAVSGRVLVYTYEPRDTFNSGDCVCAAPNGTVSKMTREEIVTYPDRIVGIVSEIPDYEIWGTGEVPVNGRIWIKVK